MLTIQGSQPDLNTIVSILAALSPILLAMLGGIGWLYKHERERRESAERQLSEYKNKAYTALLGIFFDLFKAQRKKKPLNEQELIDKMVDVNKELVLYGSDEVVRIYQSWMREAQQGRPRISAFGELFIAIRRDMGYRKTKITTDEVLRQFITDYDEAKAKGQLK